MWALTDDSAQQDIAAHECAIERELGGETSAKGVYEAVHLPDGETLDAIGRGWGAGIRGFKVKGDAPRLDSSTESTSPTTPIPFTSTKK